MKKQTRKVYCKNCRYGGGTIANSIPGGWRWCEAPQLYQEVGNEFSGSLKDKEIMRKTELNKDGECPYYERKRWKFWIKD